MAAAGPLQFFEFDFAAMGSPCALQLFARDAVRAGEARERVVADVQRLEARYSRYRDDSLLAGINRVAARGGTVRVDAETAGLLDYADTCHRESDGLFDVTSGLLRRVWWRGRATLPADDEIAALLGRIGWDRVRWRPPELTLPAGMELDFGGIVKEYAADRAVSLCREAGVVHGVVNLGGDIRIVGPRPDGAPWRIGVQHPRAPGDVTAVLALHEGAVATSGDYERCLVIAGRRYGHVIHPRTGWPVQHLASVTVVAPLCVVAGSASTVAMLKEHDGPAWLDRLGLPHCWVDLEGCIGGPLAAPSGDALGAAARLVGGA